MTGRPRKSAPRAPSGALSRAGMAKPVAIPTWQRLRDEVILRSRDPELGTELGRLFLAGDITARQFETGRRYGATVRECLRVIGLPCIDPGDRSTGAAGAFPAPGSPAWDRMTERGRDASLTLSGFAQCLTREQRVTLERVCVAGLALAWSDRAQLMRGLDALAVEFARMDARRKRA